MHIETSQYLCGSFSHKSPYNIVSIVYLLYELKIYLEEMF